MEADPNKLLPFLLPALFLAIIVRRGLRERQLKVDRLWVMPIILLMVAGSALYANPPTTPLAYAVVAAALVLGAAIGWWRGRLTRITVNPETQELTSRTSPIGVLIIAGIFVIRYGLRYLMEKNPSAVPGGANLVTDGLMMLAIGTMAAQRLEMWLRAQRLLAGTAVTTGT